jgi:hypothetical protein
MTVSVYIRNLWILVMAGCVALLGILLIWMSHEAMDFALAAARAQHATATCPTAPPPAPALPPLAPPPAPGWTRADDRALQAAVDVLLQPADGRPH